jgi:outer membrane protein assembly factor BamB
MTLAGAAAGADWPQFRGPGGDGHSDATDLPLTWSEREGVAWKTAIHGRGWSSPVVCGGQVWLTTATEDGTRLSVTCLDLATGGIVHDRPLFEVERPQSIHKFNSYASPTPVLEPGRAYVTFGSPGTACLDTATGQTRWTRRDIACNHFRGAGSSPILQGDLLLMHFDGSDHQFLLALNKETGKTVWRRDRSIDFQDLGADGRPEAEGDWRKAFATPHVALLDGRPLLISQGAKAVYAYAPDTGEEWWRVEERTSHSAGSRPVVGHGLVFVATGWSTGQLLALRPGRRGEVADANAAGAKPGGRQLAVVWKSKRNVPRKPSLILRGEHLFMIDDGGIATALEARTGRTLWRERVGGNYSASPLSAGDRLYVFSEEGKATVLHAGPQFKVLAENHLDEGCMASPAVVGSSLILRTRTHVYRVQAGSRRP